MNWILIMRIVFLSLAVFFTINNIMRMYFKNSIPMLNIMFQTAGVVGFIASMGWI